MTEPCFVCEEPADWQSPTGHWACAKCRDDVAYTLDELDRRREDLDRRREDFDREVVKELGRLRVRDEARRLFDAEQRVEVDPPEILTLRQLLARPREEENWRINGWQPANSRVILSAQAKTGKTTLVGNLIRTLVDGDGWLR